ncbi:MULTISPECIES: hypothetical protein [Mameliella]|uniref:hypothetical protein n=1 Tax=Mameliella TaxID=1434019 RepID=UPI00105697D2|nr:MULTISPECIES: hypothetical protein [Mameliella]MCR9273272.1 hypothetical protein [Paracoccaceae bacterium]
MTIVVSGPKPRRRNLDASELNDQDVSGARFFGVTSNGHGQIWQQQEGEIWRAGINGAEKLVVSNYGSVREALKGQFSCDFVVHKMELCPGQYYPRIGRPNDQHPDSGPARPNFANADMGELFNSARYYSALVGQLWEVLEVIEPVIENKDCFGNKIRSLLILACTECENQMRLILRCNGLEKDRYNTSDFVRLLKPMRLNEYALEFSEMPWLGEIHPFRDWSSAKPTVSLSWYDAYNATKHDRSACLFRANLSSLFKSLAALWILLTAQYGSHSWRTVSESDRVFTAKSVPRWRYSECYTYPYSGTGMSAQEVKLFK